MNFGNEMEQELILPEVPKEIEGRGLQRYSNTEYLQRNCFIIRDPTG